MMICSLPTWPLLSQPPFIGVFSNERTAEPPAGSLSRGQYHSPTLLKKQSQLSSGKEKRR